MGSKPLTGVGSHLGQTQLPKLNDDIVFVGLGDGRQSERAALARTTPAKVSMAGDGFSDDVGVDSRGRKYNLASKGGALAFARTFGLPVAQTKVIGSIIARTLPGARDELAGLAQLWSVAEKGGTIPSRLVLSGHSYGKSVWGDHNGILEFSKLGELAKAMPQAAAQIEDLHVNGCNSGSKYIVEMALRPMFKNVKTIWAYYGGAPGAGGGAETHEAEWEQATRGRVSSLDRRVARAGIKEDQNVATWSVAKGYSASESKPPKILWSNFLHGSRILLPQYFSGAQTVSDPHSGLLREFYQDTCAVLGVTKLKPESRALAEKVQVQTLNLLYYPNVARQFGRTYAPALQAGYKALGKRVPDFTLLSRKDALREIAMFSVASRGKTSPAVTRAASLLAAFEALDDKKIIPPNWVGREN